VDCPLCTTREPEAFFEDSQRAYLRCPTCQLVFVPAHQRLDPPAEKSEYDQHQNDPNDEGYRRFLGRLFEPLQRRLTPGQRGLDFGCGPGPTLSLMFRESGFDCQDYDPIYFPKASVFEQRFDFITATEVVEHLFFPNQEFERLWQLLVPGGTLGLMTKLVVDRQAFSKWHYKNDPTHVCFFSRPTLRWLAQKLGAEMEILGADVILLKKPASP
jgi:SAM-dependent methyltransferase